MKQTVCTVVRDDGVAGSNPATPRPDRTTSRITTPVLLRCNCGILGYPDRQCSRAATVGEFCAQHAKMDKPGDRVFRWD
jgi:hypothetical protein